jgi:ribonuclease HII
MQAALSVRMDQNGRAVLVCGVDEAGRGPLAGPVYAAAVVLDPNRKIRGLKDSKQLSEKKRDVLALRIRERAAAFAVAYATVEEIDRINILQAAMLAMKRAVEGLGMLPDEAWIDGNRCPELPCRAKAIIGGDARHAVISAASILAKTERDAEMRRLHLLYPQYGFDQHKGYPTAGHFALLQRFGACEIHRRSFMPVRDLFEGMES